MNILLYTLSYHTYLYHTYYTYSQLNKRIETAQKLVESLENDGGIRIAAEGDKKYWLYNKNDKGHNSDPSLLYTKLYPKSDEYDWLEEDDNGNADPAPSHTTEKSKSSAYSNSSSGAGYGISNTSRPNDNAGDDLVDSDDDVNEYTNKRPSSTPSLNQHPAYEESPTKKPRLLKKQTSSPIFTTTPHIPSSYDKQPPSLSSAAALQRRVTFADHSKEAADSYKVNKQPHTPTTKASSSALGEEPYQFALDGTDLTGIRADSDDDSHNIVASDHVYSKAITSALHAQPTTSTSTTALADKQTLYATNTSIALKDTNEPAADVGDEAEGDDVDWESDDGDAVVSHSDLHYMAAYSSNTTQGTLSSLDRSTSDPDILHESPMPSSIPVVRHTSEDTTYPSISQSSNTVRHATTPTVISPQINTISADVAERAVTMASGMADWAGRAVQKALKQHMAHATKGSVPSDPCIPTIISAVASTRTSNKRVTEISPTPSVDPLDSARPSAAALTTTTADKDHIVATHTLQSSKAQPTAALPDTTITTFSSQPSQHTQPPSPTITMRQEVETLLHSTTNMSSSELQHALEEEKFLEKISRNRRSINMRDAEVMTGSVCFVVAFVINIHI